MSRVDVRPAIVTVAAAAAIAARMHARNLCQMLNAPSCARTHTRILYRVDRKTVTTRAIRLM